MGDKIEFPLNNEIYFKQAEEYMLKKEYGIALDKIQKVTDENPEVAYLHALILYYLEEYEEALEKLNEYKDSYLQNEKYALSYVMLLIKNKQFVAAEAIILEHLSIEMTTFHSEWQLLEMELHTSREQYNKEIEQKKSQIKYALLNMGYTSPLEQTQVITEAKILDLYELQPLAQGVLLNTQVTPLNQRAFLERLIEKKDTEEYNFYWFGQLKSLIPATLSRFEDTPIISDIENILVRKLEKHPEYIEPLYIEMMNDLLMLYPYVEDVIHDSNYWVNLYLNHYDDLYSLELDVDPKNKKQSDMQEWFLQLNKMANRTIDNKHN